MGIRGLLAIGLTGLLVAAGSVAGVVVVQLVGGETTTRLIGQFERRAVGIAREVEASCRDMTICMPQLTRVLAADPGEDGVRATALYDGGLNRLAGQGSLALGPEVADVQQGARVGRRTLRGQAEHRVARPVRLGDGRRAILSIQFSAAGLEAAIAARQRAVLLFLFADLLAILLFGIYLGGRYLVRPIEALTAAVAAAADGSAVPIQTSPSEVARLSEAFGDLITRLHAKNAELAATITALEATRDELVRAEKLATVGRLAAGLAHEIGNPLASVLGYVEYLRADEPTPAPLQAKLLTRMDKELGRIRDTLRGLLDFSRPTTGVPGRVDLRASVAGAEALVRYQQVFRDVQVRIEGTAPPVWADPGRLRQVIVNLLLNAAEAGATQVECTVGVDGVDARLVVQDDGPGIAAELAERLFEPFTTTRPVGEGTGLGLAISQRIIEESGGRLTLVAAPDGACFEVRLPLAPSADDGLGEQPEQVRAEEEGLEGGEGEEGAEGQGDV